MMALVFPFTFRRSRKTAQGCVWTLRLASDAAEIAEKYARQTRDVLDHRHGVACALLSSTRALEAIANNCSDAGLANLRGSIGVVWNETFNYVAQIDRHELNCSSSAAFWDVEFDSVFVVVNHQCRVLCDAPVAVSKAKHRYDNISLREWAADTAAVCRAVSSSASSVLAIQDDMNAVVAVTRLDGAPACDAGVDGILCDDGDVGGDLFDFANGYQNVADDAEAAADCVARYYSPPTPAPQTRNPTALEATFSPTRAPTAFQPTTAPMETFGPTPAMLNSSSLRGKDCDDYDYFSSARLVCEVVASVCKILRLICTILIAFARIAAESSVASVVCVWVALAVVHLLTLCFFNYVAFYSHRTVTEFVLEFFFRRYHDKVDVQDVVDDDGSAAAPDAAGSDAAAPDGAAPDAAALSDAPALSGAGATDAAAPRGEVELLLQLLGPAAAEDACATPPGGAPPAADADGQTMTILHHDSTSSLMKLDSSASLVAAAWADVDDAGADVEDPDDDFEDPEKDPPRSESSASSESSNRWASLPGSSSIRSSSSARAVARAARRVLHGRRARSARRLCHNAAVDAAARTTDCFLDTDYFVRWWLVYALYDVLYWLTLFLLLFVSGCVGLGTKSFCHTLYRSAIPKLHKYVVQGREAFSGSCFRDLSDFGRDLSVDDLGSYTKECDVSNPGGGSWTTDLFKVAGILSVNFALAVSLGQWTLLHWLAPLMGYARTTNIRKHFDRFKDRETRRLEGPDVAQPEDAPDGGDFDALGRKHDGEPPCDGDPWKQVPSVRYSFEDDDDASLEAVDDDDDASLEAVAKADAASEDEDDDEAESPSAVRRVSEEAWL
ncbi:hypothetical protein M885DRAFT_625665 [Pelagophyceae sp. CCMP2097]|nr:hypothetical protein M885DRAFT_625665 [Pelagophyceae sp. CCMP2097]